jgi:ABC-type transport system involved in cytochrome c biogenesis permease subunit
MAKEKTLLQRLDAAQVVVMQLAFGLLGVGIILGAVWADQSWGRPWGWDPKETFALVTWIVYLIILHVRLVTKRKAMWTAILAIIGFAIMLFNWIGVNFFLVGLHSYA